MKKQYDYLLVGSGLFAGVFAYYAKKAGKTCLVLEKRGHAGGNIYCENIEGINVHRYGAHIFHTSNKEVWNFVNSLVEFNRYTNSPVANYKGEMYNMPFNMNTFSRMWGISTPEEAKKIISEQRKVIKGEPKNLEEQAISLVGTHIYQKLVKGYTEKQWGRDCRELPAFIIKRLPVRYTYDNNYFNDLYQGIPIGGYNKLIDGLLAGVETVTGVDFFDIGCKQGASGRWQFTMPPTDGCTSGSREAEAATLVYTGQLDEFFGYRFGKLNYRTVRFETEVLNEPNHQGNAVVNYTEADVPYTRIIEHKHFESFGPAVYANPKTVVSREYSTEWQDGMEPYYPVNDEKNSRLAGQYRELAATMRNVVFGGRLAEYKYYDMAPIIEQVLGMEID